MKKSSSEIILHWMSAALLDFTDTEYGVSAAFYKVYEMYNRIYYTPSRSEHIFHQLLAVMDTQLE